MSTYGDVDGVQAFVRHMTFDQPNNPTTDQIEAFLDQMSAKLTGLVAAQGYQVPVTNTAAKAVLDMYANLGAAGLAELTQRTAGFNAEDDNRRENKFLAAFKEACQFIESGALAAMGVPQSGSPGVLAGLRIGGAIDGVALGPIFTRRMFGNIPDEANGE